MAVVFEGEVKIMINRHRFMGDDCAITFPNFTIWLNTANKWCFSYPHKGEVHAEETLTQAYIEACLAYGVKLEGLVTDAPEKT